MRGKTACPLCGHKVTAEVRVDEFLVCDNCCEILRPAELVTRATRRTRRIYNQLNGGETR